MPRPSRIYAQVSALLALGVMGIGVASLAVASLDHEAAVRLATSNLLMRPDMATAVVLLGLAVALQARRRARRVRRLTLALMLPLLTAVLVNWIVVPDVGVGGLLHITVFATYPHLPAGAVPISGIAGLLLLLASVWAAGSPRRRVWEWSQVAAIAVGGIAFFSIAGWILGPVELDGLVALLYLPLITGIAWSMLLVAILLIHPSVGPIRTAASTDLASQVSRRLLIFAVVGLPALGWIPWTLKQAGVIKSPMAIVLFATFATVALVVTTFVAGALIRRFEAKSAAAQRDRERLQAGISQAQRLEAVGLLAGGIAHDFNNLLTAIGGYADVLAADLAPDSAQARDVGEIRAAAIRAGALTRQLLTFAGRQVLSPATLDLRSVVGGLAPMLQRLLGEDIEIAVTRAPEPVTVLADAGQLEQLLLNLAVNARSAMPAGGTLRIGTSVVDLEAGQLRSGRSLDVGGRYALLEITDSGTGIAPEVLPHIFEPFYTTRRDQGGTGLGLATVAGVVASTGGWIEVESEPGQGTSFLIYLPIATGSLDQTPAHGADLAATRLVGEGETVLLAEDEDGIRALAARILTAEGYTVVCCASGEEALARFDEQPHVSLLLTDVVMSGMSGPDLAATLRRRDPLLRVLFMSGYPEDRWGAPGSPVRTATLLAKPYTPASLVMAVRDTLEAPPA